MASLPPSPSPRPRKRRVTVSGPRDARNNTEINQSEPNLCFSPPKYPTPELSSQDSIAAPAVTDDDGLIDLDDKVQIKRGCAKTQRARRSPSLSGDEAEAWASDAEAGSHFSSSHSAGLEQAPLSTRQFESPRRFLFPTPTEENEAEFESPCPVAACQETPQLYSSAEQHPGAAHSSSFTDVDHEPLSPSRNDLGEQLNPVQIDFRYCPNCVQSVGCGLVLLRDTMPTFRTMTGLIRDCWTRNAIEIRITSAHGYTIPYDGLPTFSLAKVFIAFPGQKEIIWGREDEWQVALNEMKDRGWRDCLVAVWVSDHGCATCQQMERDKRTAELDTMRKEWDVEKVLKEQKQKQDERDDASMRDGSECDSGDGDQHENENDSQGAQGNEENE
ncbi:hypothetical protein BP6252_03479 [Coleophoma cylindrospora]|uniref:Runt domain-containing protein n=1 Tax=Coleophoma cylindrospora TaxID=1849047 RepID=A0A3D8S7S1_9HELO|nr:hypothetical protein BP6252_03479 [Coleophoma cylindrospora]